MLAELEAVEVARKDTAMAGLLAEEAMQGGAAGSAGGSGSGGVVRGCKGKGRPGKNK